MWLDQHQAVQGLAVRGVWRIWGATNPLMVPSSGASTCLASPRLRTCTWAARPCRLFRHSRSKRFQAPFNLLCVVPHIVRVILAGAMTKVPCSARTDIPMTSPKKNRVSQNTMFGMWMLRETKRNHPFWTGSTIADRQIARERQAHGRGQ